jgi:ubiquitin C-terminal hydrolase
MLCYLQVAALAPDELVGDNQYFCDFCAAKSDADRRMRLRNLPPYLCLALQRFTYDYQVSARCVRLRTCAAQLCACAA